MKVILSPAKTLDYESPAPFDVMTQPLFLEDSQVLVDILKGMDVDDLQQLMGVSESIAELNVSRFQSWKRPFRVGNSKQAIFAFNGAVYKGFDFSSFTSAMFKRLGGQVRILSGLYGVLRPYDLMQPYRLEMGTPLANPKGKDLYAFWREKVTSFLAEECGDVLVNCASKEYSSVVDFSLLRCDVVTPVFKDNVRGKYKVVAIHAKKARGAFADFMVRKNVKTVSGLKDFDVGGYSFNESLSSDFELVFLR